MQIALEIIIELDDRKMTVPSTSHSLSRPQPFAPDEQAGAPGGVRNEAEKTGGGKESYHVF